MHLISIFLLSAAIHATPIQLAPLDEPVDPVLPIDSASPPIPCDQILDRLTSYNEMAREHDQSLLSYMDQISSRLTEWHTQLSPLEGKTEELPVGTFSVLQDGATKLSNLNGAASENSSLLAIELDTIIASLRDCPK